MTTDAAAITALIQPNATIPAQLARHVPPPQPTYIPAGSPDVTGVVVLPDGESYYGRPPVIYAGQQILADPQALARAADRIGQGVQMLGGGAFAAGAGFGMSEVVGAMAGASTGTILAVAALAVVAKLKAPKRIVNHITSREEYHQHVTNTATGWFGRANGSINTSSNHTTSSTIN